MCRSGGCQTSGRSIRPRSGRRAVCITTYPPGGTSRIYGCGEESDCRRETGRRVSRWRQPVMNRRSVFDDDAAPCLILAVGAESKRTISVDHGHVPLAESRLLMVWLLSAFAGKSCFTFGRGITRGQAATFLSGPKPTLRAVSAEPVSARSWRDLLLECRVVVAFPSDTCNCGGRSNQSGRWR